MSTPSNCNNTIIQSKTLNKGKLQYPLFNTSNLTKNKIVSIKVNQINKTVAVDEKDLINERKSSFNALTANTTLNNAFSSNKYSSFNKKLQIDLKKQGKIIIPSILSNRKEGELQPQTSKNINKLNNFINNPIIDISSVGKSKLEQYRNNSSLISLNNNNNKNDKQVNNTKLSSINESSNVQSFNLNVNTSNTSQSNSKDIKNQITNLNPPNTTKNTAQGKNLFNNSITSFNNNTLLNQYFSGKKVRHTSIRLNPPPNKTVNNKFINTNNSNSNHNHNNNINSISETSIGCGEKNSKNKANNDSHLFHSVRLIDSDFHIFKDKHQEKFNEKNEKYDKFENKNDAIPSLKRKLLLNNPTAKKAPTKLFISEKLIDSEFYKDHYKSPINNLSSKDKESSFNDKEKPFLLNSAKKTTKITKINLDSNNKSCFSLRSDSKKDSNNKAKSYSTMSWEYSDKDKDKSNQHNSYVIQAKNIINKQNSNSMSYAKIVDKLSASLSSESFNIRNQDSNNKPQEVKYENKRAFNLKSTIGLVRKKNNTNKTLNITNSELISYSIKK